MMGFCSFSYLLYSQLFFFLFFLCYALMIQPLFRFMDMCLFSDDVFLFFYSSRALGMIDTEVSVFFSSGRQILEDG